MSGLAQFWQTFKKGEGGEKKRKERWIFLALLGLLLLVVVWPVGGSQEKSQKQTEQTMDKSNENAYNYADQYVSAMEKRLTSMLEKIDGAGNVQVMITLKNDGEQVVEKDRTYSENKTGQTEAAVSRSESTVYSSSSGGTPYVIKQLEPEIEGVLVAAEGAADETVVNEITYAVQVLFDVPVHKIKVVKMSSR